MPNPTPDPRLARLLRPIADARGRVVALTGAGISAESGIPTFRGPDGYWRIDGRHYQPQELATQAMFRRRPREVFAWYLYRRAVCRQAAPNPGHRALAALQGHLQGRLTLVTQNVDGLHLRAGSPPQHTFEVHGNIDYMRCTAPCSRALVPIPDGFVPWARGQRPTDAQWATLSCPRCGAPARPHVLWFDEYYDEAWYRFESSLAAVYAADLLLVVGTAGATNLPLQMATVAAHRQIALVDINIADNPFAQRARALSSGLALSGKASALLPTIAALFAPNTATDAP